MEILLALVVLVLIAIAVFCGAAFLFTDLTHGTERIVCGNCEYDTAGLPDDARCPECGEIAANRMRRGLKRTLDARAFLTVLILLPGVLFIERVYAQAWHALYEREYPALPGWFIDEISNGGAGIGSRFAILVLVLGAMTKRIHRPSWIGVTTGVTLAVVIGYFAWAWLGGHITWKPRTWVNDRGPHLTIWRCLIPVGFAVLVSTGFRLRTARAS